MGIDVKLIILILVSKKKTRIRMGGKERVKEYQENIDNRKIIILVSCPN